MKTLLINHPMDTKNKPLFLGLALLLLHFQSIAQQITGVLPDVPNQKIYLYGYDNFDPYAIDSTISDAQGVFKLNFSTTDHGVGLVQTEVTRPSLIILAQDYIAIEWTAVEDDFQAAVTQGRENLLFQQYAREQPKREQVLSAWNYLQNMYAQDDYFALNIHAHKAIDLEIQRLHQEEDSFMKSLDADAFVTWYIPIRKLLGSVARIAQYETEKIPATREALQAINYADTRLYKSGLLHEAIENHIWFIENSSGPLDSVFADLNRSIDIIIAQLKDDNEKFNLITQRIFDVLEKRSLFTSSEYLAKRLLEGDDCGCINPNFEKQLHKYGKMATGATAPDIAFTEFTYFPAGLQATTLSELNADYYLVIFAAGWCGHCREALPEIARLYPELKAKNIEVVLVSLDENAKDFAQFAAPMPFISTTDYQKWDGQAATDYQVFGTPSYFMLDKDRKILMKFISVEHLQSWVDWHIKR
jgi:thiol-disulfide isomerase/thioredoxin